VARVTYDEALREAWGVVGRFAAKAVSAGALTRDEAEQAGRLGVWRAWQTYDARKASWRTYATLWVRAYVYREAGFDHTFDRPKAVAERATLRLDAPAGGEARTLGEVVPCPRPSPEAVLLQVESVRRMVSALRRPPGRLRRRSARFDVGGIAVEVCADGLTHAEAAARFGVTRQAVQQAVAERVRLARTALEEP